MDKLNRYCSYTELYGDYIEVRHPNTKDIMNTINKIIDEIAELRQKINEIKNEESDNDK